MSDTPTTDPTLIDPLTWNCPHVAANGWGCGASAGELCNWSHDPAPTPTDPPRTFHAERRMQADAATSGTETLPDDIVQLAADDFI
ncbi:MAG TPA: hypothetical protein VLI45_09145 [Acidobacteriaceae bacterium]|nr:hypothetical protein [Acidobacteriaceae bacterium]